MNQIKMTQNLFMKFNVFNQITLKNILPLTTNPAFGFKVVPCTNLHVLYL
jgi:hypothetical protein